MKPEARGWGIGKALFGELGKEAEVNVGLYGTPGLELS